MCANNFFRIIFKENSKKWLNIEGFFELSIKNLRQKNDKKSAINYIQKNMGLIYD